MTPISTNKELEPLILKGVQINGVKFNITIRGWDKNGELVQMGAARLSSISTDEIAGIVKRIFEQYPVPPTLRYQKNPESCMSITAHSSVDLIETGEQPGIVSDVRRIYKLLDPKTTEFVWSSEPFSVRPPTVIKEEKEVVQETKPEQKEAKTENLNDEIPRLDASTETGEDLNQFKNITLNGLREHALRPTESRLYKKAYETYLLLLKDPYKKGGECDDMREWLLNAYRERRLKEKKEDEEVAAKMIVGFTKAPDVRLRDLVNFLIENQ